MNSWSFFVHGNYIWIDLKIVVGLLQFYKLYYCIKIKSPVKIQIKFNETTNSS
jgi:hypothetical protein